MLMPTFQSYQSNSQICSRKQFVVMNKWYDLQRTLKDENVTLCAQQQQKALFQKKLQASMLNYHRNFIHLPSPQSQKNDGPSIPLCKQDSFDSEWASNTIADSQSTTYSNQKRLFENEGFGDSYIFIKEIILTLSKQPKTMFELVKHHSDWLKIDSFISLVKTICGSMYENVVDDDIAAKDILVLIDQIIKFKVQQAKKQYQIDFFKQNLPMLIIKQFLQKRQIKSYSKQIIRNTLLEIAKIDKLIDFQELQRQQKKVQKSRYVSSIVYDSQKSGKKYANNSYSNWSLTNKDSKIRNYAEALKNKDTKMRMIGTKVKNKNCISNQLTVYLGLSEQIQFPTFVCPDSAFEFKKEEELNQQWASILSSRQNFKKDFFIPDIQIVRNIIIIFFSDIFKMLYSMPMQMRIICKRLFQYVQKKFPQNRRAHSAILANFVMSFWIIEQIQIEQNLIQSGKLADFSLSNLKTVVQILRGIIKDDYKGINQNFTFHFHEICSQLRLSIFNYLHELINVKADSIGIGRGLNAKSDKIVSYAVCLSIYDVSRILEMIQCYSGWKKKQQLKQNGVTNTQLQETLQKMIKKTKRIRQMSQRQPIFSDRFDSTTGKTFKANNSYVLFTQLSLPRDLSIDYGKYYSDAFKNQKIKNLVRLVLINLGDIDKYVEITDSIMGDQKLRSKQGRLIIEDELKQQNQSARNEIAVKSSYECQDTRSLRGLLEELVTQQQECKLYALDRIPNFIKIKYLLAMTRDVDLQSYCGTMLQQSKERLVYCKQIWARSKQCYIKAVSNILKQNQKISMNDLLFKKIARQRKLEEFIHKVPIAICITSPKTREKQTVLKTSLMKDVSDEQKNKVWMENQGKCVHSVLNLQFIKSLTGEPQKNKTKFDPHFTSITKFPELLCSLPEVKESYSDQSLGIKDIFNDFVAYCVQVLKKRPDYQILCQDIPWFQENLQLKLTKKIHDRIFPRSPTYQDIGFYFRVKTLDWLSYSHFKIPKNLQLNSIWQMCSKQLRTIQKVKTSGQKLNCIVETYRIISEAYQLANQSDSPATADDIEPIMIYVVSRCNSRRIISNLSFIDIFGNQSKLMSREGYSFSKFKAAVQYLDTLTHRSVGLQQTQFNRIMYQKQIQYAIYFLLPRLKISPSSAYANLKYLKENYFRSDRHEVSTSNLKRESIESQNQQSAQKRTKQQSDKANQNSSIQKSDNYN